MASLKGGRELDLLISTPMRLVHLIQMNESILSRYVPPIGCRDKELHIVLYRIHLIRLSENTCPDCHGLPYFSDPDLIHYMARDISHTNAYAFVHTNTVYLKGCRPSSWTKPTSFWKWDLSNRLMPCWRRRSSQKPRSHSLVRPCLR